MRQVEGRSASYCRRNGVNLVISAKGTTPDKNGITHKHFKKQLKSNVELRK